MKRIEIVLLSAVLVFAMAALGQSTDSAATASASQSQTPAPRVIDLKRSDGTVLKASYFAAAKPGPGVLLLHQATAPVRRGMIWGRNWLRLESTRLRSICADMARAAARRIPN